MDDTRIVINGVEKKLPDGVVVLEDDLYIVPFELLHLAEEVEEIGNTYQWVNPRRFGQIDGTTLGRGFDKHDMEELYDDIKENNLIFPLVCRWIQGNKDNVVVEVLDGERRWRCINRQIQTKEQVWSRKEKQWLPASEVYAKLPCRVVVGNDKEALKIAFMVSDRSINWGDGATAKLVKKLRKCNCTDEEILELTKKSFQWLREMDEICNLDDLTFSYLADGRINRALALRLAKIEEVNRRVHWLHASYDDAVMNHQEEMAKANVDLEKAESREEVAEAELAEAKQHDDIGAEKEAETKLETAQVRTKAKRQQRQKVQHPVGKTKNLRNAASKIPEEVLVEDGVLQPLSPGKIREHHETITKLIVNNGKDEEDKEIFNIAILHVIEACYKAILSGEEDIVKILKRQRNIQKLQSLRHNEPPPDIAAELAAEFPLEEPEMDIE